MKLLLGQTKGTDYFDEETSSALNGCRQLKTIRSDVFVFPLNVIDLSPTPFLLPLQNINVNFHWDLCYLQAQGEGRMALSTNQHSLSYIFFSCNKDIPLLKPLFV